MPSGELRVTVVEGAELRNRGGHPLKPYCWISLRDQRRRTETKDLCGAAPKWDQLVLFDVRDGDDKLTVEVFTDNGTDKPELIGNTQVLLNPVFQTRLNDAWYDIYCATSHEYSGKLRLILSWDPAPAGARAQQPVMQRTNSPVPQQYAVQPAPPVQQAPPPYGPPAYAPPYGAPAYGPPPPGYVYGPPPPPPIVIPPPPAQTIVLAPAPPPVVYVNDPYYDPVLGVGVGIGLGALAFGAAYGRPWGYHRGWGHPHCRRW